MDTTLLHSGKLRTSSSKFPKMRTSCDACGHSKLRCGKQHPSCERCARKKINCNYSVSQLQYKNHQHHDSSGFEYKVQQTPLPNSCTFPQQPSGSSGSNTQRGSSTKQDVDIDQEFSSDACWPNTLNFHAPYNQPRTSSSITQNNTTIPTLTSKSSSSTSSDDFYSLPTMPVASPDSSGATTTATHNGFLGEPPPPQISQQPVESSTFYTSPYHQTTTATTIPTDSLDPLPFEASAPPPPPPFSTYISHANAVPLCPRPLQNELNCYTEANIVLAHLSCLSPTSSSPIPSIFSQPPQTTASAAIPQTTTPTTITNHPSFKELFSLLQSTLSTLNHQLHCTTCATDPTVQTFHCNIILQLLQAHRVAAARVRPENQPAADQHDSIEASIHSATSSSAAAAIVATRRLRLIQSLQILAKILAVMERQQQRGNGERDWTGTSKQRERIRALKAELGRTVLLVQMSD